LRLLEKRKNKRTRSAQLENKKLLKPQEAQTRKSVFSGKYTLSVMIFRHYSILLSFSSGSFFIIPRERRKDKNNPKRFPYFS